MNVATKLLDILVCPQCKLKLVQVEGGRGLLCNQCQLKFPVREGIPIMLVEEALDMRGGMRGATPAGKRPATGAPRATPQKTPVLGHRVVFRAIAGPDEGMEFDLNNGHCRAMGRAVGDPTKTTVLNVDWAISLDEETKGLILQYIAQQFRKPQANPKENTRSDQLGAFRRAPDVVLKDHTLSRLHAMIFFDTIGIGILDLVSKNGTFVNGEEIESRLLKKGDTIELGETKIVFEG